MKHILTAAQMKARDEYTIREIGVPSAVLMERAALAIAEEVISLIREERRPVRVLCVCGSGNNGGDGVACARILHLKGIDASIHVAGNPEHFTADMTQQMEIAQKCGVPELKNPSFKDFDIVVDALFGNGLSRPVSGSYERTVERINAAREAGARIVAADIPSGIHADNGQVMGCAVKADVTVTMQFLKAGLILNPGAMYAGRIVTAEIGILDKTAQPDEEPPMFALEDADMVRLLPARIPAGNKGTFGKVLVAAGSADICGAAILAGEAALRAGAGMVKIVTHVNNRQAINTALPEALTTFYEDGDGAAAAVLDSLDWADVVVAGPGIGTGGAAFAILKTLLGSCRLPLVLDADALNCLSAHVELLGDYRGPVFITPHVGEMSRLTSVSIPDIKGDLAGRARTMSEMWGITTVLKDARTCTALKDGTVFINTSGNDGMATAGSGDVLAGLLGGIIAQGGDISMAGPAAVYIHGRAGDAAAAARGRSGMTARDIAAHIGDVIG